MIKCLFWQESLPVNTGTLTLSLYLIIFPQNIRVAVSLNIIFLNERLTGVRVSEAGGYITSLNGQFFLIKLGSDSGLVVINFLLNVRCEKSI